MPGELLESGSIRPISRPKIGCFLNRFIAVGASIYFLNRTYFIVVSSIQKIPLFTMGSSQIMKIGLFFVQTSYGFDLP